VRLRLARNGELLRAARGEFDAIVTTDRGIPHQQNLSGLGLAVVVLEARSNRLEHLSPLVEEANAVLRRTDVAGGVWRVGGGEAEDEEAAGRGTNR
jgi:hypothetical protein